MPLDYEERAGIAQARCMGYSFFADVFSTEVTREFIANMGSFEAEEGSKLQEFVALLGGADLDEVTQDVRSEFCALFLNMSAHPVFTSESVYLSGTHTIMQEPRNQVLAEYRSRGLAVDKDSFDWPEDHVSMEMLFMSHLCKQESDLCRQALEAEECTSIDADLAGVCDAQRSSSASISISGCPCLSSSSLRMPKHSFTRVLRSISTRSWKRNGRFSPPSRGICANLRLHT